MVEADEGDLDSD
jgi:hypothetical protein